MSCSNSERSQKRFLILLYALLFTTRWSSASERMTPEDEPQCYSRFDYEYKVIQKLVQLEEWRKDVTETINTQKETINGQETEINAFKEWRKEGTETMTTQKETITAQETEINAFKEWHKEVTETMATQKETITAQETEINAFKEWRKKVIETMTTQEETITAQETEINKMSDRLEESDRKLQETSTLLEDVRKKSTEKGPNQNFDHFQMFKNITGMHVGFTVTKPKDNTDPSLFETVIYNSASGFNIATGKFLCVHPGMYLFTATVIREQSIYGIGCYISVNGSRKVRALANNNNSHSGFPSGSGTLIIHLNAGDEVYLSGCSTPYMYYESSFSGVLIQPDLQ